MIFFLYWAKRTIMLIIISHKTRIKQLLLGVVTNDWYITALYGFDERPERSSATKGIWNFK